jgi:hypothetical protein
VGGAESIDVCRRRLLAHSVLRRGGNPPAPAFPGGETGKGRSTSLLPQAEKGLTLNMNAKRAFEKGQIGSNLRSMSRIIAM